jgi:2-methylaconitate cis-trans-isomerase PrpF
MFTGNVVDELHAQRWSAQSHADQLGHPDVFVNAADIGLTGTEPK